MISQREDELKQQANSESTVTPTRCLHLSLGGQASTSLAFYSLLAVMVISLAGCGESLPPGEAEFAAGLSSLSSGELDKAHEFFTEAERVDPARPWRLLGRARETEMYSSPAGAFEIYFESIFAAPDFDSGYTGLIRLALYYGKTDLAEIQLARYASQFGLAAGQREFVDSPAGRRHLALRCSSLLQRGEPARARQLLESAAAADDDAELGLLLAEAIFALGEEDAALHRARQIAEENDDRRPIVKAAVTFFGRAQQVGEAVKYLDKLLEGSSQDISVRRFRVEAFMRLGYYEWVEREIGILGGLNAPPVTTLYLLGNLAEATGQYNLSLFHYDDAVYQDSRNYELYRDMARACAGARIYATMENHFETLLAHAQDIEASHEYLADIHLDRAAGNVGSRDWRSLLNSLNEARASYGKTIRFLSLETRLYVEVKSEDSLKASMSRMRRASTDNVGWRLAFARLFLSQDNLDSAGSHIEAALVQNARGLDARLLALELASRLSDSAAYNYHLAEAERYHPREYSVLRLLATHYANLGESERAREMAERMMKARPGDLRGYRLALSLAASASDALTIEEILQRVIEKNPGLAAAYQLVALEHIQGKDLDGAVEFVDLALALDSSFTPALIARGVILESRGLSDSALSVYRAIIASDPSSADAHNNLAWLMASKKIDLLQAANIARQAVSLSAHNPKMLATLGWAHYQVGDYLNANVAYLEAVRRVPQDPLKRYLYGLNFEGWGKTKEAKEQYQEALNLGITGEYKSLIEEALSRLDK